MTMSLIGYARVSTDEQNTDAQIDQLKAAGCSIIFEDKASGSSRDRAQLRVAIDRVGHGDTLVVLRIDHRPKTPLPVGHLRPGG